MCSEENEDHLEDVGWTVKVPSNLYCGQDTPLLEFVSKKSWEDEGAAHGQIR